MTTTAGLVAEFPAAERQTREPGQRAVTVKQGDTLYSIARAHRVRLDRLKLLNGLTDDVIEIGQKIWLPADKPAGGPFAERAGATP